MTAQIEPTMATPNIEWLCGAKSSGSFSRAAAKIIGVAIKKLKRAASSLFKPTNKLPPIVAPEREKPGSKAKA